jgi:hypothetical protein
MTLELITPWKDRMKQEIVYKNVNKILKKRTQMENINKNVSHTQW